MEIKDNADEFLQYMSNNYEKMAQALKNNNTYDEEVFQNTILKCYENIIKNNKIIERFDNFFFWCCKNNYIMNINKERKNNKNFFDINCYSDFIPNYEFDIVKYKQGINDIFLFIINKVEEKFNTKEAMIWVYYNKLKSEGKITYQQMSDITGVSLSSISSIITKIKKYVQNNMEIIEEKKKLYDEYFNS